MKNDKRRVWRVELGATVIGALLLWCLLLVGQSLAAVASSGSFGGLQGVAAIAVFRPSVALMCWVVVGCLAMIQIAYRVATVQRMLRLSVLGAVNALVVCTGLGLLSNDLVVGLLTGAWTSGSMVAASTIVYFLRQGPAAGARTTG
jgi:hypothetical protein